MSYWTMAALFEKISGGVPGELLFFMYFGLFIIIPPFSPPSANPHPFLVVVLLLLLFVVTVASHMRDNRGERPFIIRKKCGVSGHDMMARDMIGSNAGDFSEDLHE